MLIYEETFVNYTKVYNDIIKSRILLKRNKKDGEYYEEHHIIPKSLGGSDLKENLILLTAREHYIVHILLYKIYDGENKSKMAYALFMMMKSNRYHYRKFTSRQYEIAKKAVSVSCSGHNNPNYGINPFSENKIEEIRLRQTGTTNSMYNKTPWNKGKKIKPHSNETKHKMSKSAKGKIKSEEHKQNLSKSLTGKPKSEEHKKKLSESSKGRVKSKEELQKLSLSKLGTKQPILICPHCHKEGGHAMKRWHFGNCRSLI